MKLEGKNTTKKNYNTPKLSVYGNISELTQNVNNTGMNDNPTMKT